MPNAGERIECWAVGARTRGDLQRLHDTAEKLVTLTSPGTHDPLEVDARWKEVDRLAGQIRRDAADSAACGVWKPGDPLPPGRTIPPHSWISAWGSYGEKMLETADPHARAVGLYHEIPNVINRVGWQTNEIPRPEGSPPQGQVTLRMGPGGKFLFTPQTEEDLETAKHLERFLAGESTIEPGVDIGGPASRRQGVLNPELSDALEHLRGTLSAVTTDTEGHIVIMWNEQAHVLEIAGYADPYKGQTWTVRVTPNYTVQNQMEIAEYVRHYEDAIAEDVRHLYKRTRRMAGWNVPFYATHGGVQYAPHVGVGPPEGNSPASYQVPDFHPEDTYTPPDFNAPPARSF